MARNYTILDFGKSPLERKVEVSCLKLTSGGKGGSKILLVFTNLGLLLLNIGTVSN